MIATIIVGCIGFVMLYFAIQLMIQKTKESAKKLMFTSVGYITLLQIIYVIDKMIL
jgi:protoheme IX farnesyltransferase